MGSYVPVKEMNVNDMYEIKLIIYELQKRNQVKDDPCSSERNLIA